MIHKIVYVIFLSALWLLLMECSKPIHTKPESDQDLFSRSSATAGYTYYKGSPVIYRSSPQSAHAGYFRVRFNDIAGAALTDSGRLPVSGAFPSGSLIVKELHQDSTGNNIIGYAVMEKLPDDPAQNNGWVWAEYQNSGAGYMIGSKGGICVSCHSMNDRDKVRLFDLFP